MRQTWRDQIRPLVAAVIARVGTDDMKALRLALIDARPSWVSGASWMTKVWRDEVNQQLGIKAERKRVEAQQKELASGQTYLFEDEQAATSA